MGEIADMILDGTLCQQCGTFIGHPVDYPRYCSDCKPKKLITAKNLKGCLSFLSHKLNKIPGMSSITRISSKGVPHIVVTSKDGDKFSATYFLSKEKRHFKIFDNYANHKKTGIQNYTKVKTGQEVYDHFYKMAYDNKWMN
jgi:hypothetical protein